MAGKYCAVVRFLYLTTLILAIPLVNGDSAPTTDCTSVLVSMADCLSYVTKGSKITKPEGNCCSGLKSVLKTNAECLCEGFKASKLFGIDLDIKKAMGLPAACHVNAPSADKCGLSLAPAGAPDGAPPGVLAGAPGSVSLAPAGALAGAPGSGFVSINCGGPGFTDGLGIVWRSDTYNLFGSTTYVDNGTKIRDAYATSRKFPHDKRKYCYNLNVTSGERYLIRASFQQNSNGNGSANPKFDLSFGASPWSLIEIDDMNTREVRELIFLALDPTVSVCLSNATSGQPFISTLELRQFDKNMYSTTFEKTFYLLVSARVNFGATSDAPVRFPDDKFDRIWESDFMRTNFLVDVAPGTEKVSTNHPISVKNDVPPQKVMQTAVVGRNGTLTYRLNLNGAPADFPANGWLGWACAYLAEIENLRGDDRRIFKLTAPFQSTSNVNIKENAPGRYGMYEPMIPSLLMNYTFMFAFNKTADSTLGPILNALELSLYIPRIIGTVDGANIGKFVARYSTLIWAQEGGDPCLPVPWTWVRCNSDPQPLIVAVHLSSKNLSGNIPLELTNLTGLQELFLDGNSLSGSIPDFHECQNLTKIHLQNNKLTGKVPSSLVELPNLQELYIQENQLSGKMPTVHAKNLKLNYSGNDHLRVEGSKRNTIIIIAVSIGGAVLLIGITIACYLLCKVDKPDEKRDGKGHIGHHLPTLGDSASDAAHCFSYMEIEEATKQFERKIGSGGFGPVYYGKLMDGREIAVKLLAINSCQGGKEFSNEVTLLSRIHHRNLVRLLGYCLEKGESILVYEFMHNGTLGDHLYGPSERGIDWIKRLEIAEGAAKGIEYLHTGCVPSIIHRDLKTSNILLDINMKAKVSDFGLSKLVADENSYVTSIVKGTMGYMDPEYYTTQQLRDKSDVYSFGVILLELICGKGVFSCINFGADCRTIVEWATTHIENGDLQGIIDPSLVDGYNMQSMWKIAENALKCLQLKGHMRPPMSEVLKEIQDAILIENKAEAARLGSPAGMSTQLLNSSSINESARRPTAR